MDLDDAAADLYQISPEEFVERRKRSSPRPGKPGP